ncbi:E3 ubiquitin/ISG15 ligase TRIM25-like isoform X2 [Hoplias malabaricus]
MASKPSIIPLLLPEDELVCSICQGLVKVPVTTPCGHNFCMNCIKSHWGKTSSPFYCPHCRRKFLSRPDLQPNTVLCSIMEHVAKVWAEPELCSDSDEERADCDVCEESRKLPAVKTCLTCLASFCSVHVLPHAESPALKKHSLCAAVKDIKELQCRKHGHLLEMFCMTHRVAFCWQCSAKHRTCKIREVNDMRREWKASIDPVAEETQSRKDAFEKANVALDRLLEGVDAAAEKMKEEVDICFKSLRDTIEHAQDRVIAFIEAEKVGAFKHINEQEIRLDKHMLSISRVMDQIKECRSNDSYFNFLLPLPQLPPNVRQLQESDVQLDGQAVERMVLDLQHLNESLESQLCATLSRREELRDKDLTLEAFKVVSGNSKRRQNLLKYSCEVTFDPLTASASVLLSEDSLSITVESGGLLGWKDYQVNTEMGFRVLCSQNFTTGQHYWEISPPEDLNSNWAVGVTYKSGKECYQSLGQDQTSWCVRWLNVEKAGDKWETFDRTRNRVTDGEEATSRTNVMEGATCKREEQNGFKTKLDSKQGRTCNKKSEGQKLEYFLLQKHGGERCQASKTTEDKAADEDKAESEVPEKVMKTTTQGHEEENKAVTGFFACHNQQMHIISHEPPGKIGVHLDCDRGWLAFFTVSDFKVKLCYRFQALLSEPLYPAVWLRDPEKTMTIRKEVCAANSCEKLGLKD